MVADHQGREHKGRLKAGQRRRRSVEIVARLGFRDKHSNQSRGRSGEGGRENAAGVANILKQITGRERARRGGEACQRSAVPKSRLARKGDRSSSVESGPPPSIFPVRSANVIDALLVRGFFSGLRLSRQLQDGRLLPFAKHCQQHQPAVRKFQGIVVRGDLIFVDLAEDSRVVVDDLFAPGKQTRGQACDVAGEGQFRSGH